MENDDEIIIKLQPEAEADPRFPSGVWEGYWLQRAFPGQHEMVITLMFTRQGVNGFMTGAGCDRVGRFNIDGEYRLEDQHCLFRKRYDESQEVRYEGFSYGADNWMIGTWRLPEDTGRFFLWPKAIPANPAFQISRLSSDIVGKGVS